MNEITDYNVGDRVTITAASLKNIENGNRSIHAHPCDSFVATARILVGTRGTVTHRFRPGYEMTVAFDNGTNMHMKDHWVERA
jgi:hypothetical protein